MIKFASQEEADLWRSIVTKIADYGVELPSKVIAAADAIIEAFRLRTNG